jgi:hypothetical protein
MSTDAIRITSTPLGSSVAAFSIIYSGELTGGSTSASVTLFNHECCTLSMIESWQLEESDSFQRVREEPSKVVLGECKQTQLQLRQNGRAIAAGYQRACSSCTAKEIDEATHSNASATRLSGLV